MTHQDIEEMIKFGAVHAFRYCILNNLDFSMGEDEDDDVDVATQLYSEMWADENNLSSVKNEFTKKFNPKGI